MPPRRQKGTPTGKRGSLQVTTRILRVSRAERRSPRTPAHYPPLLAPSLNRDDATTQSHWAKAFESEERGVVITVPARGATTEPHRDRAKLAQPLRAARQTIDGGDRRSITESRRAPQAVRKPSVTALPLLKRPSDRDPSQRTYAAPEALSRPASVALDADLPGRDVLPRRVDAVTVAGSVASVSQQVSGLLDRQHRRPFQAPGAKIPSERHRWALRRCRPQSRGCIESASVEPKSAPRRLIRLPSERARGRPLPRRALATRRRHELLERLGRSHGD